MDLQGDWFSHNKRGDLRLIQRAIKERWPIPQEVFDAAPLVIQDILSSDEKPTTKIRAILAAVAMNGQNHAAIDSENKQPDQPGLNVTVNQYASDGGTITNGNKAALDAASTFIALMASDASEPGGVGVVFDEGGVPCPPAPEIIEPETP